MLISRCPKAVENFCVHSRNGYYNGHIFHRVIKQFMIQTGDPTGMWMCVYICMCVVVHMSICMYVCVCMRVCIDVCSYTLCLCVSIKWLKYIQCVY